MSQSRRTGSVERQTAETSIEVRLRLDGDGTVAGGTSIGFFDHMLASWCRHGQFDLELACRGDLHVDQHHTVEDVGICLGQALDEALGDRAGVQRFGHAYVAMDEALARAVVDLSGRGCLVFEAEFREGWVGDFPVSLVREFFAALARNARLALHLDLLRGLNDHHSVEALFKASGRALRMAAECCGPAGAVPSTKGSL